MKKPKIKFKTIMKNKKLNDFDKEFDEKKFEIEIMEDESVADK